MEEDVATLVIHSNKLTTEEFDLICQFISELSILSEDRVGAIYEQDPILIKGNIFEMSDVAKDCYKTLAKAQMVKNMTVVRRKDNNNG